MESFKPAGGLKNLGRHDYLYWNKQKTFMKKLLFFSLAITMATNIGIAQTRQLKLVLQLKVPRQDGANAGSVAWHPIQKKYYAAMAGNPKHFIGVYDTKGKQLNPSTQESYFDVRGLWYNPTTKTLQMNGYNDYGWAEYKLNAKGFPIGVKELYADMNQPDEQSVGAYDPKAKAVYFLNGEGNLEKYNYVDGIYDTFIELYLGAENDDEFEDNVDVLEEYNSTTVVYTGIPKAEIGLFNVTNRRIELYDLGTGYVTRTLALPDDAPQEDFLDFAYANGIFWIFDTRTRIWKGYK